MTATRATSSRARAWSPARASFPALGTTAVVLLTDPSGTAVAEEMLRRDLDALDRAASRFRADSEIMRLAASADRWVTVSPLLGDALAVALHAAEATDGAVDPTVERAMVALGYDRDFADIDPTGDGTDRPAPVPGWRRIELDHTARRVRLPRGVGVDLGATAKALAADRAAVRIGTALGCGVLVSLGGDIAVAGTPPPGGWRVEIGDDHTGTSRAGDQAVTLSTGGLATSSVVRRAWRRGGRRVHHIIDPRTGDAAPVYWRTASVAAASCVDANAASTAAIVRGRPALEWLSTIGLPARLVRFDGLVAMTRTWPAGAVPVPAGGGLR